MTGIDSEYEAWSDNLDQDSIEEMDAYFSLRNEFEYQERIALSVPRDTAWQTSTEFVNRYEPVFAKAA